MSDIINKTIWEEAQDWASQVWKNFESSKSDPTKSLNEEESRIYSELREFGWFTDVADDGEAMRLVTEKHIAIIKYGKIKWKRAQAEKKRNEPPKPTKWERVSGKGKGSKRR